MTAADLAPILGSDDAREGLASFVERMSARATMATRWAGYETPVA